MKKVLVSLLVICLIISASFAFADLIDPGAILREPSDADLRTAPIISNLEIHNDNENNVWLEVTVETPLNVREAIWYFENHEKGYNQAGYIGNIVLQYAIDGAEEWQESGLSYSPNYNQNDDNWNGVFETGYLSELHVGSQVKARAYYNGATESGIQRVSDPSNELVLNENVDFKASTWAQKELESANELGLIPERLKSEDLTKSITREEFAEVSVKAYEAITGNTVRIQMVLDNPFKDTNNQEVVWAYNLGITKGTSDTEFSPNKLLNRETAATMLTRVYKKATLDGWTLEKDGDFKLDYEKKNTFADDKDISLWAKDSVYFMNANGIINGVGDNKFAPKNTTSEQEAKGYANATREQAIVIAARLVKNMK